MDLAEVTLLVERAAQTLEAKREQLLELEVSVARLRAEGPPQASASRTLPEEAIAAWAAALPPEAIERHTMEAVARPIIEATNAATIMGREAAARVETLLDSVLGEVAALIETVSSARGSMAAMSVLPQDLAAWEAAFKARVRQLLDQIDLPWTSEVSHVARLLSHVASDGPSSPSPRTDGARR